MDELKWATAKMVGLFSILVLSVMVTSGMGIVASGATPSTAASPSTAAAPHVWRGPLGTNGGRTVCGANNNQTIVSANLTISIGGNITVCNGGTLWIIDTDVTIVSYTGTSSSLAGDLNQRYQVNVTNGGHLHLVDSLINTSAAALDAYPDLNLTVSGKSVVSLDHSNLSFAGSVYVTSDSTLYLNDSNLVPNTALPTWAGSSLIGDSSYSPSLTVSNGSSLVTAGSTIQDTYRNPSSISGALDENFTAPYATPPTIAATLYGGLAPPNPNDLINYTYTQWSGATVNITLDVTTAFTATVGFTAFGSTGTVATGFAFSTGTASYNFPVPVGFIQKTLNAGSLAELLGEMQAGTAGVSLSALSTSAPGTVLATGLVLAPSHNFNVEITDFSHFYAIDSRFDVNWANATCVPLYDSNKVLVENNSIGDFVNTTALTTYTQGGGACGQVNAFQVDTTSSYWVYDWVRVNAVGAAGTGVPGVQINIKSNITGNVTLADLATLAANLNSSSVPVLFRNAVWSEAVAAGSDYAYGNTSSSGSGLIALPTAYVTHPQLQDGQFTGLWNLSFTEKVTKINGGGTSEVNTGKVLTVPSLCSWPYRSLGCAYISLPKIQLPFLTANLEISNIVVTEIPEGICASGCSIYEGTLLFVNATIADTNTYQIAGNALVPVYLYNVYGDENVTVGEANVTNFDYQHATNTIVTFSLSLPFQIPSSPIPHLWASIDPFRMAPESGTTSKNATYVYVAVPAPEIAPYRIDVVDGCTGAFLTLPASNSCSTVRFESTIINSGDAPVNVSTNFTWAGAINTQIGTLQYHYLAPGASALANVSMEVSYLTTSGTVTLTVDSTATTGPPPIRDSVTSPTLEFTDFTSLRLSSFGTSIVVPGGAGAVAAPNGTTVFRIGDAIGVTLNMANDGGGAVNATLSLGMSPVLSPGPVRTLTNWSVASIPAATATSGPGALNVTDFWHINTTAIGTAVGKHTFVITLRWSNAWIYGVESLSYNYSFNATIGGPAISIIGFSFAQQTLAQGQIKSLQPSGTLSFEAPPTSAATLSILLSDPSQGLVCAAASNTAVYNGSTLPSFDPGAGVLANCITAGTYNLQVKVTYLGSSAFYNVTNAVTITSTSTSSAFIGSLLFWILIIVVIVVVAIVGLLLYLKKFGQGNLVECGECGELIPESAIACPHCGAEFERNLVRCSRCASSIPATSKVCPECSVLLVGREEDPSAQAFMKFVERYRVVARKELGDNYNENSFWEWWKRQQTYIPFATWKQQQQPAAQGFVPPTGRSPPGGYGGMQQGQMAPPDQGGMGPEPGYGGGGGSYQAAYPQGGEPPRDAGASGAMAPGMKVCPSCGKMITESSLLCPFCSAVTR